MADRLERAPSGRARCRACATAIDKGSLRFGEELAGAYGDGDGNSVFWFHPRCAAERRPEKFLLVAREHPAAAELPEREALVAVAEEGVAHPRLERLAGAERASSGRALCRECRNTIDKGAWRIRLSTFAESGFFDPLGFVHAPCARTYFEVPSVCGRVARLLPPLADEALEELRAAEASEPPTPAPPAPAPETPPAEEA